MNNKRTRGGRTVLQQGEVQLAIPLPVSLLVTMKALIICSWSRFSLGCRVWLRVRNLSLALLLPRRTFLLESRLVLDSHHMAVACALLDVTLYYLEHATQFSQALSSPMHMVVRDEVPITWR